LTVAEIIPIYGGEEESYLEDIPRTDPRSSILSLSWFVGYYSSAILASQDIPPERTKVLG
jgi:hypothetical protein